MLGSVGLSKGWKFAAVGKHPVARDYFSVGETEPLINGFSDWVGNGFRALNITGKTAATALRSFRFFVRGPGREMLACGVLRDSSDAVGRPYPLLLMGCGPLKGWEDAWDLLPLACETTWEQMEQSSAGGPGDVARFEARIRGIRPPAGDWNGLSARRGSPRGAEEEIAERMERGLGAGETIVLLPDTDSGDVGVAASLAFSGARSRGQGVPNAVFLGGTSERTTLAFFNRSLTTTDFAALWAEPSGTGRN